MIYMQSHIYQLTSLNQHNASPLKMKRLSLKTFNIGWSLDPVPAIFNICSAHWHLNLTAFRSNMCVRAYINGYPPLCMRLCMWPAVDGSLTRVSHSLIRTARTLLLRCYCCCFFFLVILLLLFCSLAKAK